MRFDTSCTESVVVRVIICICYNIKHPVYTWCMYNVIIVMCVPATTAVLYCARVPVLRIIETRFIRFYYYYFTSRDVRNNTTPDPRQRNARVYGWLIVRARFDTCIRRRKVHILTIITIPYWN